MLAMKKNNIEITNEDVELAEKILLPKWWKFDRERRDFIKNLDTIDLEAVPGSGKTTALLAKLLILERKMPFENGSGILVLSHTNTAVDEIKNKLEKVAPKLFKFPNFIGTIQSFVDTFLTKPYWLSFLNINFNNIDDDYYNSKMQFEYNKLPYKIKIYVEQNHEPLNFFQKILLDSENNLRKWVFWEIFLKSSSPSNSYKKIFEIKNKYKQEWIITFDEAYYLAFCYLKKFPKIIKILQKRFQYVFVDEMQDMEQYQVDILEKLFYKKLVLNHCFQRIWDKNQAIYSGFEASDIDNSKIWNRKILKIEWSHRLTKSISKVVNCFQIEWETKIVWENKLEKWDIKPIMIVYKEDDLNTENWWENKILQKFWEIITEKKELEYFKNILKLFLRILRENNIENFYRKEQLFSFLQEGFSEKLLEFKDKMYYFCKILNDLSIEEVSKEMDTFFGKFISEVFKKNINTGISESKLSKNVEENKGKKDVNIFTYNDLKIPICTTHSVKWETHTCTLYMESSYKSVKNSNWFEIESIKENSFIWKKYNWTPKEWKKFSKLMYVGFSRPTHLLCFAIWEERYNKFLKEHEEKLKDFWEIVTIKNNQE